MSLMDDILVTGVDALNPLEVKAGMDSLLLKQKYGDRLVLQGGINAVLWDQKGRDHRGNRAAGARAQAGRGIHFFLRSFHSQLGERGKFPRHSGYSETGGALLTREVLFP